MIIFFGSFPQFIPKLGEGNPDFTVAADGSLSLTGIIVMVTLSASALIMLLTKTSAVQVTRMSLFGG